MTEIYTSEKCREIKLGFVGANFTTKHLHNELVKEHSVIVWSHAKPDMPFSEKINFNHVELPWERLRNYLRKIGSQRSLPYYYQKLLSELWEKKPDVVIVLDFYKLWFIQALIYKLFHPDTKLIIHSETKRTPPTLSAKIFFCILIITVRLFQNKVHHIFTYSEKGAIYLQKVFPNISISHLILPIDENTPLYTESTPGPTIRILMPARFVGFKRHIDVIKAAENITPSQHIQIDFATFSHDSAPLRNEVELALEKSSAKNIISIVDAIKPPFENYYKLLEKYDAIILPSENEGLGAVVPAALRCGRVAIITDMVPASMYIPESLYKYIIHVGDTPKLTNLLNSLDKKQLFIDGQIAAKYIYQEFSSKHTAAVFTKIICDNF